MVWYGMDGMAWYGMVWYDMVTHAHAHASRPPFRLEPMNERISATPGLKWSNILPSARKLGTVSYAN